MSQPSILGRWYADPMSTDEASQTIVETNHRLERRLRHGGGTLCCRLRLMRGRFWLGSDISDDYWGLQHLASRTPHGRALLELVYGQLLLSRQQAGALEHLEKGFSLARHLFTASDYFTVMNRHRQLKHLPQALQPSPPSSLAQLLVMAQVIERLEQPEKKRGEYSHDSCDTYG